MGGRSPRKSPRRRRSSRSNSKPSIKKSSRTKRRYRAGAGSSRQRRLEVERTAEEVLQHGDPSTCVVSLCTLADGSLVSAGLNSTIRVWDPQRNDNNNLSNPYEGPVGPEKEPPSMQKICNVAAEIIACAYGNGVVGAVRLTDPRQFRIIHKHSIDCYDVCSFQTLIASVGSDILPTTGESCESIMVYSMISQSLYRNNRFDNAKSLCFVDGQRLAIGTTQNTVVLWNFVTNSPMILGYHGQPPNPLQPEDHKWVTSLCTIDEDRLASGCENNTVIIWNINTRAMLHTFNHPKEVHALCLVPSETSPRLLCGWGFRDQRAGGITLWDVNTGAMIRSYQHDLLVSSITLLPNGRFAVASDEGSDIKILRLDNPSSMLF